MKEYILILDFGSQYTHLIKTNLGKIRVLSFVEPADVGRKTIERKYADFRLRGVILSGGAHSVDDGSIAFQRKWLDTGIPVLGVCYGHQLLAKFFGGEVRTS